jgi:hypothetical protein
MKKINRAYNRPVKAAAVDRSQVSREDVDELVLTITNDGDLYRERITPAIENLKRKYKNGKYDRDLAVKLWQYVADEGVRRYDKEFGSGRGSVAMLSPATRKAIAEELRDYYEDEIMYEDGDIEESRKLRGRNAIKSNRRINKRRPVKAAESYGWELDSSEAWEAYEFACDYFGKENLDAEIVSGLSTDELAEALVYIFRMNDFREWDERNGDEDGDDEDTPWDEKDFVLNDAEVGFDWFEEEVEYYREHKDELSEDDLYQIVQDAQLLKHPDIEEEVQNFIEEKFYSEEEE